MSIIFHFRPLRIRPDLLPASEYLRYVRLTSPE
jgi:hypothetical protein